MQESPWFRRAGPVIASLAALGAFGAVATVAVGAPTPSWAPAACEGPPIVSSGAPGTWVRLDPRMDVGGTLVGQRLAMGDTTTTVSPTWDLPSESFVAAPTSSTVLVGADDGVVSSLRLLDIRAGCVWPLAQETSVIRRATLSPDGSSIYETRVGRRDRADQGVWRRALTMSGSATRVMEPLVPDARFGQTFTTEFAWSDGADELAVQACGEISCRVRFLEPASGRQRSIANPALGTMVGLTMDRLVVHGSCRGLPCPLLALHLDDETVTVLAQEAGQAMLVLADDGSPRIAYETDAAGLSLRAVAPDGSSRTELGSLPLGERLVPLGPGASALTRLAPGTLLTGPEAGVPFGPDRSTGVRRLADGHTAPFLEASR